MLHTPPNPSPVEMEVVKNELQDQPGEGPGLSFSWTETTAHMEEETYLFTSCSNLQALTLIPTQHEPPAAPRSMCSTASRDLYLSGPWGFAGRGTEGDSVHVWLSQVHGKSKPCHTKASFLTLAEMGTTQTGEEVPQECRGEKQDLVK